MEKPEELKNQTEKSKEELQAERKLRKLEKAENKKVKKEVKEKLVVEPKVKENKEEKDIKLKVQDIYQSQARIVRVDTGKPIGIDKTKNNILITSALPYVNNEPHLGNIIGCVLSADVFARYSRLIGNNTLYICGTDEFGTATETKALQEGISPQELCDKFNKLHREIYEWFDIDFDNFGRTPTEIHKEITLDIFNKLKKNGFIQKRKVDQFKCMKCNIFLADRYLTGICHHEGCGFVDAGGDQCDKCGKLIVATELKEPKCKICSSTPELLFSWHYFIDLPQIEPKLQDWLSSAYPNWSKNSVNITKGFLNDGLKSRCITRDLKWGVKVPCEDDEDLKDKVFYVWFDAPIGYLSITGNLVENWEDWWKNPENVTLYQFMGKDNVTFHTVIFPSSLIGTGDNYTKVNHLSTTEFLNYEGDKFSKSRGVGVFGSNAKDTGIPAEVWRFYLLAIRPETGDTDFYWENFADKVNNELKNNLGNLCHRVFSFINSKFEKKIPTVTSTNIDYLNEEDIQFITKIKELFAVYTGFMDKVKIKEGLETFMRISSEGNNYLQKQAPWDVYKKDVERCKVIMIVLAATIRFIASIAEPFIPSFSAKVYEILNWEYNEKSQTLLSIFNNKDCDFNKEFICLAVQGRDVKECAPLFAPSKF